MKFIFLNKYFTRHSNNEQYEKEISVSCRKVKFFQQHHDDGGWVLFFILFCEIDIFTKITFRFNCLVYVVRWKKHIKFSIEMFFVRLQIFLLLFKSFSNLRVVCKWYMCGATAWGGWNWKLFNQMKIDCLDVNIVYVSVFSLRWKFLYYISKSNRKCCIN